MLHILRKWASRKKTPLFLDLLLVELSKELKKCKARPSDSRMQNVNYYACGQCKTVQVAHECIAPITLIHQLLYSFSWVPRVST